MPVGDISAVSKFYELRVGLATAKGRSGLSARRSVSEHSNCNLEMPFKNGLLSESSFVFSAEFYYRRELLLELSRSSSFPSKSSSSASSSPPSKSSSDRQFADFALSILIAFNIGELRS